MIGNFFLDVIFNWITYLLNSFAPFGIGSISWDIETPSFEAFLSVVRSVCYFLPIGTVGAIVQLVFLFGVFRIAIRLIRTIWDLLPFV